MRSALRPRTLGLAALCLGLGSGLGSGLGGCAQGPEEELSVAAVEKLARERGDAVGHRNWRILGAVVAADCGCDRIGPDVGNPVPAGNNGEGGVDEAPPFEPGDIPDDIIIPDVASACELFRVTVGEPLPVVPELFQRDGRMGWILPLQNAFARTYTGPAYADGTFSLGGVFDRSGLASTEINILRIDGSVEEAENGGPPQFFGELRMRQILKAEGLLELDCVDTITVEPLFPL